jgi:Trk K+ transport system NAD-binding subunit
MRIIIVAGGEVGYGLSQALASRHEVVVVDRQTAAAEHRAADHPSGHLRMAFVGHSGVIWLMKRRPGP